MHRNTMTKRDWTQSYGVDETGENNKGSKDANNKNTFASLVAEQDCTLNYGSTRNEKDRTQQEQQTPSSTRTTRTTRMNKVPLRSPWPCSEDAETARTSSSCNNRTRLKSVLWTTNAKKAVKMNSQRPTSDHGTQEIADIATQHINIDQQKTFNDQRCLWTNKANTAAKTRSTTTTTDKTDQCDKRSENEQNELQTKNPGRTRDTTTPIETKQTQQQQQTKPQTRNTIMGKPQQPQNHSEKQRTNLIV